MKTKIISFLVIALLILTFCHYDASACTIFNASQNNTALAGNNEDWYDKDAKVWFLPADGKNHGRVYFGFYNADPQGGMNDQGVFIDFVAFFPVKLAPSNFTGSLIEKVLKECSTLDQALDVCRKNIAQCLGYGDFMIADQFGGSAIISWDWNTNTIQINKKSGTYQLLGYGEPMLKPIFEAGNYDTSVENFQKLLDDAHQGDLTVYSNIYDLKNKKIYLYYLHNYNYSIEFDLNTELQKGPHLYDLSSLFPQNGYSRINGIFDNFDKNCSSGMKIFLAVVMLILCSSFIFWPVYFLSQKRKSKKLSAVERYSTKKQHLLLTAKLTTILNSILCIVLLCLLLQYSSFIYLYGLSICGNTLSFVPLFILTITICEIVFGVIIWKNKLWPLFIRLYYSFITAIALLIIGLVASSFSLSRLLPVF